MKRTIPAIILNSFFVVVCMSLFSCANIISPGGGPRDSIPPRLIGSIPKDSALNVSSSNIVLTFDEYIQLQSVNENLIVSPNPKSMPFVDYKLHNVTVKLKDSLEKNTTYAINFGNAIKDVNEGNLAKEFTYVFSTGKTIDSNQYKGYVLLAETGKTDSTLLVVLHNNTADSSIVKNIPRYITKLNSKGYFSFKYLPEGKFSVYVVPNDFSKKYDDSTKLFAFLNEPVLINKNTRTDTLYAYQEYKKKEIKSTGSSGNSNSRPGAKTNAEDKRLKYTVNLEGGQQDLLGSLQLSFNRPLKSWDSSKIVLLDTSFKPLIGYKLSLDTGKTKISLEFPWKEKTAYRVIVNKDAVVDTSGISLLKSDSAKFVSKREADYGSCRMRFTNIDLSKNPVLQLVIEGKIFESVALTGKEFVRKRFQPGEFEVRVLFDKNKNGIWDPGSFREKKQPEIVLYFSKKLIIRADRDTDQGFVF
ncbi:MAG: Ig-like domain-containing protein [Chitinophagaceae bacterium]|nr:Ig-like domain-containing protein [Chitinophagaceae bacterium]